MRVYYFTVATPGKYSSFAQDLVRSAANHGMEIHVLGEKTSGGEDAKLLKIEGILGAPSWADRVVFIDADMLVVDPEGLERYQGAILEPWRHPEGMYAAEHPDKTVKRTRIERLYRFAAREGLECAIPGGPYAGAEWNSGVIVGNRSFLNDLALEWKKWWSWVLEANDGEFRRDQISFKFAYIKIHKQKYQLEDLPREYNWLVKRWGFKPEARLLHKAGRPGHRVCRLWERAKEYVFQKNYKGFFENPPQEEPLTGGFEGGGAHSDPEPKAPDKPPIHIIIDHPRPIEKNLHWYNPYPTCDCPKGKRCKHAGDFRILEELYTRTLLFLKPKKLVEWSSDPTATIPLKMGIQVLSITPRGVPWSGSGYTPRVSSPGEPSYYDLTGWWDSRVFLVDWREREICIDLVYHQGPEDSVIILHDAQRKRYQGALAKFPFVVFLSRGFCLASRDRSIFQLKPPGESPGVP